MASLLDSNIDVATIVSLANNTMILKTSNRKGDFISMKIYATPPYEYLPSGKVCEYKNQEQEQIAKEWAEAKALELQKRDWQHQDEIDAILYQNNPNLESEMADTFDNKDEF